MVMPNFLLIGAAKAGTSSIYKYLKQHPQVYMSPVKEPGFFAFEGETLSFQGPGASKRINKWSVTDLDSYQALYKDVRDEKAIGEASPIYFYFPKSVERIKHYLPNIKLIAMLRDPVERAFSHYMWAVRDGAESLDFEGAIEAEAQRLKENWGPRWRYSSTSFYSAQLKLYFEEFNREQIQVYLYEDFKADSMAVMQDIFRFLEIDDTFTPDLSKKHNVSVIPRNKALHQFLSQANPIKSLFKPLLPLEMRQRLQANLKQQNLFKPQLSPEVRKKLVALYRDDILQLQELLPRDLSTWLQY
jgi:hypothetical protein